MSATPEPDAGREHLRRQLEEIGQGTVQEWMRIVDLTGETGFDYQARVTWQDHQGVCVVGEHPSSDEHGAFRITVHVEDLGPLPPLGPENDPAQRFEQEPEPLWVLRTWADVRRGDTVRMPGTDVVAAITDRLWHPSEDPRGESWHVVSDGSIGQWAHTSDRVVRPGECVIVSPDIPGSERGRWMDPAAAVEIQLPDAQALAGIEAFGWESWLRTIDTAPNAAVDRG